MSAHLPVAPLDSMPPAINSFPWTTTLLEGASWSHPTSIDASINLLDLLATDSNIASQVVSRQPTPPPFQTRPPRPPHSAESTAILSLSSSSNLASRRRATFPSALTVPVTIPATIEEPLEHVFPSAGSKRLFHHVKSQTSTIIVALGKGNHRDKNPFMAMATRLMRLNPTSHAQTAFRHSLLSLSSAHVAQQFNTSSPVQSQEMRVRTAKSKRKALVYLSLNSHTEGYTDLLLGTCLTLFLRNVGRSRKRCPLTRPEALCRQHVEAKPRVRARAHLAVRRSCCLALWRQSALRSAVPARADRRCRSIQWVSSGKKSVDSQVHSPLARSRDCWDPGRAGGTARRQLHRGQNGNRMKGFWVYHGT